MLFDIDRDEQVRKETNDREVSKSTDQSKVRKFAPKLIPYDVVQEPLARGLGKKT